MELVLVRLQVAELGELLATVIKLACKGFDLLVDDFVCANIASLSKGFAADIAAIGPLPSVSSFVCLEVSQLRE